MVLSHLKLLLKKHGSKLSFNLHQPPRIIHSFLWRKRAQSLRKEVVMPLYSDIPSSTFDPTAAFATSSCIQHAQEQNSLCRALFIFGVSCPVIVWPLLPSTSEVVSYRILACSSLVQLILSLPWSGCAFTTDVNDTLQSSFQRILSAFMYPVLCCYFTVGVIGHRADKSGKRLGRKSFDVPAYITVGMLPTVVPMFGENLFSRSSTCFTTVGLILMGIAWRPGTELAMNTYYHFATRRISSLYWLPQNGAGAHFDPWWSHSLRFIWAGYTLLLAYVSLATIRLARDCQPQLGQSYLSHY